MIKKELNIWGKPGCELPNGKRCDSCCSVAGVKFIDPQTGEKYAIEQGERCKYQTPSGENGKQNGCLLRNNRRRTCINFKCGEAPPQMQARLVLKAFNQGDVTKSEAEDALSFWPIQSVERILTRS